MTMVAACRFPDGGVVIADTRATWAKGVAVFQDTLQKVIPLAAKIGVAFSGDVAAAEIVIRELRRRMRKKPSNRLLHKLN